MKRLLTAMSAAFGLMMMSGCFLPDEQRGENQVAYPDQLASVQAAVDQFQEDTGVLPINTFDETTNLYQRYVVDFRQLVPRYMQEPPGTSFENGGTHQFVLVNVEEEPEVKVIDLTSMNKIRDLRQRVHDYIRQHDYAPIKDVLDHNLFTLDYKELGYAEQPYINSPYNETMLPLLFTNEGDIIIDYKLDLMELQNAEEHLFEEDTDLRSYLYQESPFVPLFSVPYSFDEDEGIIYDTRFYETE
ncbi:hypothetical protein [Shouchella patagoniensis]|uniref:hypothetical protein n=1 Tax=Shouchella patagoniensis TaxID=228576 RepID=UPI0009950383|nr:hypothetical protein [Shouchella patagoniensis]